jgi:hypothetical protein
LGRRIEAVLAQDDGDGQAEGDHVGPVAESGAGVPDAERVGDDEEAEGIEQGSGEPDDLPAGADPVADEGGDHGEGDEGAEDAELLAGVRQLPGIGAQEEVADADREVGDDRRAGRVVDPLEPEVVAVGRGVGGRRRLGVGVLGGLEVGLRLAFEVTWMITGTAEAIPTITQARTATALRLRLASRTVAWRTIRTAALARNQPA